MDPKCWAFGLMNAGVALGISSVGAFLPTFIKELGFSPGTLNHRPFQVITLKGARSDSSPFTVRTQLISVIPYACASVMLPITIASDRLNKKGIFLMGTLILSAIGYIVLLCEVPVAGKIVGACIITTGLHTSIILLSAWLLSNTAGYTKRASAWALAETFGPCFSILGTRIYDTPPRFVKGHATALGLIALSSALCAGLIWWMQRENMRRDKEVKRLEELGEIHAHRDKSLEDEQDFHIDFRYIL